MKIVKNMLKRNYKVLVLLLLLAFASCSFTTKTFNDPDKDKLLVQVITYVLQQGHFDPIAMNDEFSTKLFSGFLESLDPTKRYFYESDYKDFEKFKRSIDDQLKVSDITFFNVTYERLMQRISEAKLIYKEVLSQPFDFSEDEVFNTDYDKTPYAKNKKELRERWRQQLKFSALSYYNDVYKEEEQKKEKDDAYEMKTKSQIEQEAREATLKNMDVFFNDNLEDFKREDWFSTYIDAIVGEFDPHTYYLMPKSKEDFNERMAGKLEGIGAQLQKRMDNIKIIGLISGGPAWRSKELEVEDVILKVKQENEEIPIDLVGMRINDAIKYIKGPKDTKVTLTIKKVDGTIKDVTLVRDVIEINETYAKASVVKKDGVKFGVINLPSFYVDFEDYKKLNAAADVKRAIENLKSEGMEGLILDLRDNGGGSLPTVVEMAGLFIKDGPIVQVRSTGEPKEVLKDRDKSITWEGPLVILVNELSASASEIMAAAMQDYKRAIIIGSKQTYGKGTVQNVLNLNNLVRNNASGDLGALALTTQKYYRISGGSVQLEGVKSDVQVPDKFSFIEVGEKDKSNALPWDEIDSAEYTTWDNHFDYEETIKRSNERMSKNAQLKLIEDNARLLKSRIDETIFPLNYVKYRQKLTLNEKESKRFDEINKYQTNLTFESPLYEKKLLIDDSSNLKEKRDRWHTTLSQDVYIEEALNVLQDLKTSYKIKNVARVKE